MAKIDDGGPAANMKLRDYFAEQALVGMLSNVEAMKLGRPLGGESMADWIARAVYEFADAMLRARRAQSPADVQAQHLGEFGK